MSRLARTWLSVLTVPLLVLTLLLPVATLASAPLPRLPFALVTAGQAAALASTLNAELELVEFGPGATPLRPGDSAHYIARIWNREAVPLTRVVLNLYYDGKRLQLGQCNPAPATSTSGWANWPNLVIDLGGIGAYNYADVDLNLTVLGACPPSTEITVEMLAEAVRGSETLSVYEAQTAQLGCEPNPEPGDLEVSILAPSQLVPGVRRYYVVEARNTGTASLFNVHAVVYTDKLTVHEQYPAGEWADPEFQWVWHEIAAGAIKKAALLFEMPTGSPVGKVFHTHVEFGADALERDTVYKDMTVAASAPRPTPTPTTVPLVQVDLTCTLAEPANGQAQVGDAVILNLAATNIGARAIPNLSVRLDWDAACLVYQSSAAPAPEPEVGVDGSWWNWQRWGPPMLAPGATANMQVRLSAASACGPAVLSATVRDPASPFAVPWDSCSRTVTVAEAGGGGLGPAVSAASAGECTQLVVNRTFELTPTQSGGPPFWQTAGELMPRVVTETVHMGRQSLLIGRPNAPEAAGDGWAWQWVTLPEETTTATLHFTYRVVSADGDVRYDRFEAGALDTRRMELIQPLVSAGTSGWTAGQVDLAAYAGQTVAVGFHVRQDGNAGSTWAWVDDVSLCVEPAVAVLPAPAPRNVEGLCPAEEGALDFALSGMPDFDQVREGGYQTAWTLDAAAAAADVLWWLDSVNDTGQLPPPTVADGYDLVTAYSPAHDDHSPENVSPLMADLATRFGTAPVDVATALNDYISDRGLGGGYSVTRHGYPDEESLSASMARGDGQILLLGLYEWQGETLVRLGGHYVALAGVACDGGARLALSDPWRDAAESGQDGLVLPSYRHTHSGTPRHTPHDEATLVSHDVYALGQVDGVLSLVGYSRWLGDLANFIGLNTVEGAGNASAYRGGMVFTRVDEAIRIERVEGGITTSGASAQEAVLRGTVTRQGWPESGAPGFSSLITLWRPYDLYPTYGWVLTTTNGAGWKTPAFAPGTYTIRAKGGGTLANLRLSEELGAGTTTLDLGTLLAGDVHGDDRIDALDVSTLAAAIASGQNHPRLDLNADGAVNGGDLALARGNLGNGGDVVVGSGASAGATSAGQAGALGAEQGVVLSLVPAEGVAHLDRDSKVNVRADTRGQAVDTVEAHLTFDPALLRVADVKPGSALPLVMMNRVDNERGRIDLVATTLEPGGAQGDLIVAEIHLRPLALSEGTWIRFRSGRWPYSMAAWQGASVLQRLSGARVEVQEAVWGAFLPLVKGR